MKNFATVLIAEALRMGGKVADGVAYGSGFIFGAYLALRFFI